MGKILADPPKRKTNPSPRSLANLKPAKKGEVRNPLGINRGRPISDAYENFGNNVLPEKIRLKFNEQCGEEVLPKGMTWNQAQAVRIFLNSVVNGEVPAAREIADRVEGKPKQRMEVTGADGTPLMPAGGDLSAVNDDELKAKREAALKVIKDAEKKADDSE